MGMSGSGERVVFVFDRPGDDVLSSGGTIARLRSEGAQVAVLFAEPGGVPGEQGAVQAAMDVLDVRDWRVLHQTSEQLIGGDEAEHAIREVVDRIDATAVVLGSSAVRVADAAFAVARQAALPLFRATRMSASHAQRLTAVDVDEHVPVKLQALAPYTDRWRIVDGALALPDGTLVAVTGSETYEPVAFPHDVGELPATPLARFGASVAALAVGMAFGVLGTIGHQTTVTLGPAVVPIGLILALAGATALLVGLRMVLRDRLVVSACALGLLGTVFLLSLRSAGGSVLVPAGLAGTLWSIAPALIAAVVLGWPKLPARR